MALDPALLARAAALRKLDDEVRQSARTADHAPLAERYAIEHQALVGPYHAALERLRVRDVADLDFVLTYLETRPDFLGSGYLASRIIRALAKLEPSELDRPRVDAALAQIEDGPSSEQQRAAASLVKRLAAGSPRRSPRVLQPKRRPAVPTNEPDDDEPHVITVKGRAV